MENKEFRYTYKAPTDAERREIAGIRRQYLPQSEGEQKLARLRALDARVQNLAVIPPLVLGVLGLLVFGLGMTMILLWDLFTGGVIVAGVGALIMLPAYPLHRHLLGWAREKYGEEILRLSDELLGEDAAK